jgi:hypothetical protein
MLKEIGPYIAPLVILLIVLRRAGQARRLRTTNMWLIPGLAVLATGTTLSSEPFPSLVAIGLFVLAAAAGAGAGYFRALHIELSLNKENGQITSQATQIGTLLVVGFMALRFAMEYLMKGHAGAGDMIGAPHGPRAAHGVDLFRLADAALIFSTAMMIAQRVEIWRRAQPLLAEYRAHKADEKGAATPAG